MSSSYEIELPGVYLDGLVEDPVPAVLGDTPVLINLDPEPDETGILRSSHIRMDIATLDATGTIDVASTQVYVRGVLAFDAGTFQAGYNGLGSTYYNPQTDVLHIQIDPTSDFASEELILVRVVSKKTGGTYILDETYSFTVEDVTAPRIIKVEAVDLNRVRVTFSESVKQSGIDGSALAAEDWLLERLGDYITPLVSASVLRVEAGVVLNTVDLITDIPLTPGGTYRVTASNLEDIAGNSIEAPYNVFQFFGWTPPSPDGRTWDLYRKLPKINQREDETLDLLRFIGCLQELAGLLLYDIDKFIDILDPDLAPEAFVDAMLEDLGNPFDFELSLTDKRRLAQVLVDMYRLKGTGVGIKNVIRFFLSLEVAIDVFNINDDVWFLGESELGVDTILAPSESFLKYSFQVIVAQVLTDSQRKQLRSIVEYMKPAHTHFVRLVEPSAPPEVLDHMELGLSELGDTWYLH